MKIYEKNIKYMIKNKIEKKNCYLYNNIYIINKNNLKME